MRVLLGVAVAIVVLALSLPQPASGSSKNASESLDLAKAIGYIETVQEPRLSATSSFDRELAALRAWQAANPPAPVAPPAPKVVYYTTPTPTTSYTASGESTDGYDYGYCTWYVKELIPAVPDDLGNAANWGYALGYNATPAVGAIAWTTAGVDGHVGVVEAISSGMVLVKEMNGPAGWGEVDSTWYPIAFYAYIHI